MAPPTETPGQVWDRVCESALRSLASTQSTAKRSALVALRIQDAPPKADSMQMARIPRNVTGIDAELRKVIRDLVSGEAPWPLVLYGPAGTGKTCAALCLLDYAGGIYFTVSDLCNKLIQSQQGRLEWTHEGRGGVVWPDAFWHKIGTARLAVLDELGCREKVSDAHYEAVKQFVDERAFKPFVAITNLSLQQLGATYDDRILSRLAAGTKVQLGGPDRRINGATS